VFCAKCDTELEKCKCPDLAEKMRKLSGEGGPLSCKWCETCDNHYARCFCVDPVWRLRTDGKLYLMPEAR
jgi:hypothetical protein